MSIDIYIIIIGVDTAHKLGIGRHLDTRTGCYRTFFLFLDILLDKSIMDGEYIYRLSGLSIYHRPHTLTIAIYLLLFISSWLTTYLEITGCKILHGILHPGLNIELVIRLRHLGHLYGQATKHPSLMSWHEIVHAITTVVAMKIGCIQQMIAQMPHKQVTGKVTMKRFRKELVSSYFT